MGVIFTRFKAFGQAFKRVYAKAYHLMRKKTTLEVLEGLEKNIRSLEQNRLSTEQRRRKIVGHLILYSVGLYVVAAFLFYFYFFPAALADQIFYITPLLVFPVIMVLVKRLVTWYYSRKLSRDENRLENMKDEKKRLLDEVMDKETYKVAKIILEKFAPDQLRNTSPGPMALVPRRSGESPSSGPLRLSPETVSPRGGPGMPPLDLRKRPMVGGPTPTGPTTPQQISPVLRSSGYPRPPGPPMPRPILPRERGYLDKLVEYLVGDGPGSRYALICRQCESHNGMALKEEFEYMAFRCCYCYYWNPARKQRPHAPRLPTGVPSEPEPEDLTSNSELESATDTDEDLDNERVAEPQDGLTITELEEAKDVSSEPTVEVADSAEQSNPLEAVKSEVGESTPEQVQEGTTKCEDTLAEAKEAS